MTSFVQTGQCTNHKININTNISHTLIQRHTYTKFMPAYERRESFLPELPIHSSPYVFSSCLFYKLVLFLEPSRFAAFLILSFIKSCRVQGIVDPAHLSFIFFLLFELVASSYSISNPNPFYSFRPSWSQKRIL